MPEPAPTFLRHMPRLGDYVSVDFLIDPDGRVVECDILYPQVSDEVEANACEGTLGKRVGRPARDSEGQPTYGKIGLTSIIRGSTNELPDMPKPERLEIMVSALPSGESRQSISLLAEIDGSGQVRHCRQMPDHDIQLSSVGCAQAMAHTYPVRNGAGGEPVSYIDEIGIDFVVGTDPAEGS